MEINIRVAEEKDFPRIIELIHELAVFENQTDQLLNSVERMMEEKEYFQLLCSGNSRQENCRVCHLYFLLLYLGRKIIVHG